MIRRSVDDRQVLTNQIQKCKFGQKTLSLYASVSRLSPYNLHLPILWGNLTTRETQLITIVFQFQLQLAETVCTVGE